MTNALAISDLTMPPVWVRPENGPAGGAGALAEPSNVEPERSSAIKGQITAAAPFDVAVPSGNSGAEPQRLDATKAGIVASLIDRYVKHQKEAASVIFLSVRQDAEAISGAPTNKERTNYWAAPYVRPVNWTRANTFSALQEWEGVIAAIDSDHITASLVDLTAGERRATEEAQIPLSEINETDRSKLVVGRVFRWAIGYQRTKTGTRRRISNLIFRDLPRWSKGDFAEAQADAERLMRFLGSGQSHANSPVAESGQG